MMGNTFTMPRRYFVVAYIVAKDWQLRSRAAGSPPAPAAPAGPSPT